MGYQPYSNVSELWYKWFAWHPVTVNGEKVWLKFVYRKREYRNIKGEIGGQNVYKYGTIFDVLKNIDYNSDQPEPIPPIRIRRY